MDALKDPTYWKAIRKKAAELGSDGCTDSFDIYIDCCFEHDVHWETGMRLDGTPISPMEANNEFRRCIQSKSKLGFFSPVSWVRFLGVSARLGLKKIGIWR